MICKTLQNNQEKGWIESQSDRVAQNVAPQVNNGLILDVGCGSLNNDKFLIEKADCFVGIDLNIDSLKILAKEFNNISLITANAEFLPFKNDTFDVVYEKDMLHHTENPVKALNEIYRVSKNRIIVLEARWGRCWARYGHLHFKDGNLKDMIYKLKSGRKDLNIIRRTFISYPFHIYLPREPFIYFCVLFSIMDISSEKFHPILRKFLIGLMLKIEDFIERRFITLHSFNLYVVEKVIGDR